MDNMVLIRACMMSDLAPGEIRGLDLLGRSVMVINIDGTIYAMDSICSHAMGNLTRGKLDGFLLECPRHQWRFDVRTGKLMGGPPEPLPTNKDLRTYAVSVHDDCVDIDLY